MWQFYKYALKFTILDFEEVKHSYLIKFKEDIQKISRRPYKISKGMLWCSYRGTPMNIVKIGNAYFTDIL